MKTKIITSLLVIGVVGAIAGGTTFALFNDNETSSNNTFSSGALDLQIDYSEEYNGEFQESQELADGGAIFQLSDVKPGDEGVADVSIEVEDNPAYLYMNAAQSPGAENGCTNPESEVDNTCSDPGVGDGELGEHMNFVIWEDDGDKTLDEEEKVVFNDSADQLDLNSEYIGEIDPDATEHVGVAWNLPMETGNEIQTDSKQFNFSFTTEQARHNDAPENEPEEGDDTSSSSDSTTEFSDVLDLSDTVGGGYVGVIYADGDTINAKAIELKSNGEHKEFEMEAEVYGNYVEFTQIREERDPNVGKPDAFTRYSSDESVELPEGEYEVALRRMDIEKSKEGAGKQTENATVQTERKQIVNTTLQLPADSGHDSTGIDQSDEDDRSKWYFYGVTPDIHPDGSSTIEGRMYELPERFTDDVEIPQ